MDITVMRGAGMLYQEQPGGMISNIYNAEIVNKTDQQQTISIVPAESGIKIKYIQAPGVVGKGEMIKTIFFVMLPASRIHAAKTDIRLQLISGRRVMGTVNTTFVGPVND